MNLPMEELPEYYTVPLRCFNCGCKFIDDEPDMYPGDDVVPEAIHIVKGMKINEVNCPVCGCKTLLRWIR